MLKYSFGTPKRHILVQNRVLWRILRRCPWWRLGCRWFLEPPKKIAESPMVREVAHARKRNPLSHLNKILHGGRYRRHNHHCQFWWRSVRGLRGGGGLKFALLRWLWSSPLQHSHYRASVWYGLIFYFVCACQLLFNWIARGWATYLDFLPVQCTSWHSVI